MIPNTHGIYFYQDVWYRFHRGQWFRSTIYDGAWVFIIRSQVPLGIVGIPPEYPRSIPSGYHRIPYADLHRNWRHWDRERHWHKHAWYRHELQPNIQRERVQRVQAANAAEHHPEARKSAAGADPLQRERKSSHEKQAVKAQPERSVADTPTVRPSKNKNKKAEPDGSAQVAHSASASQEKQRKPWAGSGRVQ